MKKELIRISRDIRTPIYNGDVKNSSYLLYFEEANLDGVPYSMPFIILPTRPCSWLRESGGCFECGYSNLSNKDAGDRQILSLLDECLKSLEDIPHQMVAIGTSGSFLDIRELSKDAQNEILRKVSLLPEIRIIGIESRPEFVTSDRLREIGEIVYPKRIMLGMGLESSNDLIRDFCINKGLRTKDFIKARDIAKQYDNISALAYVLLGKPFLPKVIDMMDSITSISFAVEAGFDRVVLMATSLRQNTLANLLYKIGEYNPATPRVVIEVLKGLKPEIRNKVIIANPRLPKPIPADQCPVCSELLEQLITMYKYSSNYSYLALSDKVNFDCQCIEKRGVILPTSQMPPLEELILDSYERVLSKIGGKNGQCFSKSGAILR